MTILNVIYKDKSKKSFAVRDSHAKYIASDMQKLSHVRKVFTS